MKLSPSKCIKFMPILLKSVILNSSKVVKAQFSISKQSLLKIAVFDFIEISSSFNDNLIRSLLEVKNCNW